MSARKKRSRGPAHDSRLHNAPRCGPQCPSASDADRVAELEAEVQYLRDRTVALNAIIGVDLSCCDQIQELWAAQHRRGSDSQFLTHNTRVSSGRRISKALLDAVATESRSLKRTTLQPIDLSVFVWWTLPHAVVPSLVAAHVVGPFVDLDWVLSGQGVPRPTLFGARELREANRRLRLLLTEANTHDDCSRDGFQELCRSVCAVCSGDALPRIVEVLTPFAHAWPSVAFIRSWCAFRAAWPGDQAAAAVAAAGVFANASYAGEWIGVFNSYAGRETILTGLAGFATSPDHVTAVCACFGGRVVMKWTDDFWTSFFVTLAPKATIEGAIVALCDLTRFFEPVSSTAAEDTIDTDSVLRFFAALAPSIDSETGLDSAVKALRRVSRQAANPVPDAFYRSVFLPLARKVGSLRGVWLLCVAFVTAFSAELWAIAEDMPHVLASFVSIIRRDANKVTEEVHRAAVTWTAMAIEGIAEDARTVEFASDMLDTVLLPLVPFATEAPGALHLRRALVAVSSYRSDSGDSNGRQRLAEALRSVVGPPADEPDRDIELYQMPLLLVDCLMTIHVPVTAQAVLRLAVPRAVVPAAVAFAFVAPFVATSVAGTLRDDERGLQLLCPAGPVAKTVSTQMRAAVADASTLLQCCKFDVSIPVGEAKAKEIVAALKEYTPKAEVKKLWREQATNVKAALAKLERHVASLTVVTLDQKHELGHGHDSRETFEDACVISFPPAEGKRARGVDANERVDVRLCSWCSHCIHNGDRKVCVTASTDTQYVFCSFGSDNPHVVFDSEQLKAVMGGTSVMSLLSDKGAAALLMAWVSTIACYHAAELIGIYAESTIEDV